MPRRDHIEWISGRFLGRDVGFPNNTTWRLTEVLAEKSTSFDEGPQEASAVFSCVQTGGSKINGEAIVRIRMQYEAAYLYHQGND